MRTPRYHAEALIQLLKEQTVATVPELAKALGAPARITVFRKLKHIGARNSYSHRGQYYALVEDRHFDDRGLWAFENIRFARYGTLLATAEAFVHQSPAGCFTRELERVLQVGVKETLLKLFRQTRLARLKVAGRHLYCSSDAKTRQAQILMREQQLPGPAGSQALSDEQRAALVLFVSLLDEKQRRLYAGLESLKMGRGGDQAIAEWLHLDVHTVIRGRRELLTGQVERDRVRTPGAGRKPVKKKRQKSSTPSTDSSSTTRLETRSRE